MSGNEKFVGFSSLFIKTNLIPWLRHMVSVCWPFKWHKPMETDFDPVELWDRFEASQSGGSNSTSQTMSPRNSPTRELEDEDFDF